MPLITTFNLAKSYGAEDIFSGISVSVPDRARIGLVGANGVGKTTLLRVILGLEESSEGAVQAAKGLRMGYLPQEASFESLQGTLWTECLEVFRDLRARQAELTRLEHAMSDPGKADGILEKYGRLQHEFEILGGYTYETRIRQVLTGLGFAPGEEKRPIDQLSGGQRTRALLAKLLLSSPDLLLMDEPTNHLDISAIEWLESYLKDWDGGVLIVSHDRYFLDQVVNTIWEMDSEMEFFRGNYSAYLVQREARYKRLLDEYQAQQEFIEKEEDYIRRNISGQNARQAQGRRKRLERMLEEARLTPPGESRNLRLNLEAGARSGDLVLRTTALDIGYADEGRPLFGVPDLTLVRGECAAIIGPNGAGKTTFLKTLLEEIPPYSGKVVLGANLKVGYFSQAHEGLHLDWDLMKEIEAAAPQMRPAEIRDYLAKFLFSGDDVFKEVSVLSGGERGRLALACLALQGANLLLLDEPTNHLDLPAQEVLQSILKDYQGTILLVSHDRYLIDALATQVWEVLPAENRLRVFDGTYTQYKSALAAEAERLSAAENALPKRSKTQHAERTPSAGSSKTEMKKRQMRLEALEAEISGLEAELAAITRQLESPTPDGGQIQKLGLEYNRLQGEIEARMVEWGKLAEG